MRTGFRTAAILSAACLGLLGLMQLGNLWLTQNRQDGQSVYRPLPEAETREDALIGLNQDFTPNGSFVTNLPIVVLRVDRVLPRYDAEEEESDGWTSSLEARWGSGTLRLIDTGGENRLSDPHAAQTAIRIRRRGHSSMLYDKPQYTLKTVTGEGLENPRDLLGMGASDKWILNGSMADKSMLRNFLAYRVASEVQPETPDCRFCEVFLSEGNGPYTYQGVYLLMESIGRGKSRIRIDAAKGRNAYTSYIIRRDRYNAYDTMLDTWGREQGLCPEDQWIGVKYPGKTKQTPENLRYIAADFSRVEKVLYSENPEVFKTYDRYIDVGSFVDYFLLNEFFGNYDSGEHSTIMWKNTGGKLHIGPVWDFDQAMNNVFSEEQDPDTLAMTEKPLFKQLVQDKRFLGQLQSRYAALRRSTLSEAHVFALLEEAAACLRSAQQREWFRWAKDYQDGSGTNPNNYYLSAYEEQGVTLDRFNTSYPQELNIIRAYLRRHGRAIPVELTKRFDVAQTKSGLGGENVLFLAAVMLLLAVPSYLIGRRGN